jgi:hypothetical protein
MGPVHFFRDVVAAAQVKWEAAKTALNDKIGPLRDRIGKFGKGIEKNLQTLSAHTWKNLSSKLPTGLSQRLSNILLNAQIIPNLNLNEEELKSVSPNLFQKMTGEQLKGMDDKHLRLILPNLTADQARSLSESQLKSLLPNLELKELSSLYKAFDQSPPPQNFQLVETEFLNRIASEVDGTDRTGINQFVVDNKDQINVFLEHISREIENAKDIDSLISSNQIALSVLHDLSSKTDDEDVKKTMDQLIQKFLGKPW